MKTRSGFVSNSSSSSFIITCAVEPILKVEILLSEMADEVITNRKELDGYFKEWFDTERELLNYKPYLNCLAALERGETIYIGSASNAYSDGAEAYVYESGVSKGITNYKVIQDGH
jgi:hypothetical protein